jgi:hypothetical protein
LQPDASTGAVGGSSSRDASPTPSTGSERRSRDRERPASPAYLTGQGGEPNLALAPPPLPPIGPRSQHSANGSIGSLAAPQRTPSPGRKSFEIDSNVNGSSQATVNGTSNPTSSVQGYDHDRDEFEMVEPPSSPDSDEDAPTKPSAKALGKRKVSVEEETADGEFFFPPFRVRFV